MKVSFTPKLPAHRVLRENIYDPESFKIIVVDNRHLNVATRLLTTVIFPKPPHSSYQIIAGKERNRELAVKARQIPRRHPEVAFAYDLC